MALAEIEFELSAHQYELMGYPGLHQGESLSVVLGCRRAACRIRRPTVGLPCSQEPLPPQSGTVGPATYAFAGQIVEADLFKSDGAETGVVVVQCGDVAAARDLCPARRRHAALGHLGDALS